MHPDPELDPLSDSEPVGDRGSVDESQSGEAIAMPTPVGFIDDLSRFDAAAADLEGYALVADLLRRQDEALSELDRLNVRIEQAIDQITASREEHVAEELGQQFEPAKGTPEEAPQRLRPAA